MKTTVAAVCLILAPFLASASSTVAESAKVIVSGANVFPVVYEPIQQTQCKNLALPGTYQFYRYPSDGHGRSGPEVLVSKVEIGRAPGQPGMFFATEIMADASLQGFLLTPYIQLWQYNGCTLVFARDSQNPLFVGRHTDISDPLSIFFYGFGGNASELRRL